MYCSLLYQIAQFKLVSASINIYVWITNELGHIRIHCEELVMNIIYGCSYGKSLADVLEIKYRFLEYALHHNKIIISVDLAHFKALVNLKTATCSRKTGKFNQTLLPDLDNIGTCT